MEKAKKLINYAYKLRNNISRLKHSEGWIAEIMGQYTKPKRDIKFAYDRSYNKAERILLKEELDRVN